MKNLCFCIVIGLLFLVSCTAPMSKEAYIERFAKFVQRVDENHNDYNRKDWEWTDSRFEKYNTEWYEKYKNDLTSEEQLEVKALVLKYYSMKGGNGLGKFLNDLAKDIDFDNIGESIQKYVDKNLDEDIEKIVDRATEVSDSIINVLEDAIKKLDESLDN